MFFILGISDGTKEYDFAQTDICNACGRYGRYIVYMTYTVLSLFFIPCFKWNKQYYVRMSCCGKTYKLDPEVGKKIARGENVQICPGDLENVSGGWGYGETDRWANWKNEVKTCSNCGYTTDEDFEYCPKCGKHF